MQTKIENEQWYQSLIDDCKSIVVEAEFTARWSLVEGYWSLGKRIRKDNKAQEFSKGNKTFVQDIGRNLGISTSTLYYALQAYDKYPDLDSLPEGKNITWNKLINKYLPSNKIKKHIELPENINVDLKRGDFRKLIKDIPDNSIDLVLTDPPYPKEYLPLWSDLAKESERILKPSGFLISYSGQAYLPEVLNSLSKHLKYYWLGMVYHKGRVGQRFEVNMFNRAKPILFYYKQPLKKQEKWLDDVLISEVPNKEDHEWGQNPEPFKKLIECFTEPNATILDPFFGGGCVIDACIETKRNVIGFEMEKQYFEKYDKTTNSTLR